MIIHMRDAKRAAGKKAVEWIQNGMIVGLGSGSTASWFIESLIECSYKGLRVETVASSRVSAELAKKGGLPVLDINSVPQIDITVDGADEIDEQRRMIKGGGGAHTREKILASSSKEMIVVVDASKVVSRLGRVKLPIEILFFGSPATRLKLEEMGYKGKWRLNDDGSLFITENGNLLYDVQFDSPPLFPEEDHEKMIFVPGVVDTGFFFNLASRVIVGYPNGDTKIF